MKIQLFIPLLLAVLIFSCKSEEDPKKLPPAGTPVAKKIVKELTLHDDTRVDNYFWMTVPLNVSFTFCVTR